MKDPYIRLFVRDWLCSRRVMRMSGNGVKAYINLLCESWLQEPKATLPDVDKELSEMSGVSSEVWDSVRDEVRNMFADRTQTGRIFNDRLMEECNNRENKARPGNRNAEKTQTKRKRNAAREDEDEDGIELNSPDSFIMPDMSTHVGHGATCKEHIPPTMEELTAYCAERYEAGNPKVSAKEFFDHYETRGWIPKGYTQKMKSWKASVRTWERNASKFDSPSGQQRQKTSQFAVTADQFEIPKKGW